MNKVNITVQFVDEVNQNRIRFHIEKLIAFTVFGSIEIEGWNDLKKNDQLHYSEIYKMMWLFKSGKSEPFISLDQLNHAIEAGATGFHIEYNL